MKSGKVHPDDQEPGLFACCWRIGVPKGATKETASQEEPCSALDGNILGE